MIYTCLVIGLIVLFFISFTLFIKRVLQSSAVKKQQVMHMNQKLDRIIELLEKDKK
ncbi:MutT/nudix [Bacillus thuringiensis serovar tochigiensis BGSC 4Y1]|nr:MutT/nudix [Bacillus thuringiensis serovar tochigiensis BGSC 4Y1]